MTDPQFDYYLDNLPGRVLTNELAFVSSVETEASYCGRQPPCVEVKPRGQTNLIGTSYHSSVVLPINRSDIMNLNKEQEIMYSGTVVSTERSYFHITVYLKDATYTAR